MWIAAQCILNEHLLFTAPVPATDVTTSVVINEWMIACILYQTQGHRNIKTHRMETLTIKGHKDWTEYMCSKIVSSVLGMGLKGQSLRQTNTTENQGTKHRPSSNQSRCQKTPDNPWRWWGWSLSAHRGPDSPVQNKISREKNCSLVKFLPSGVWIRPAVLPEYLLRD